MEVVFGIEHLQGGERVTLSLPAKVELDAAELSAFIAALTRVRDGMLPAILRHDGGAGQIIAAADKGVQEVVIRDGVIDAEAAADRDRDAEAVNDRSAEAEEICHLCNPAPANGRSSELVGRPSST